MPMPHWKYRPYATVDLPDRTWPDRVSRRARRSGARPTCATATRRSSTRWTARASGGSSTSCSRSACRRSRWGSRRRRRPTSTSCALLIEEELVPGRDDDRRPDAGPPGAHRAHVRGDRGREARNRAPLQLDVRHAAPGRLPSGSRRASPSSPCAARGCAGSSPRDRAGEVVFQYSPESFHHTELEYALEICEAVAEEWGPTPEREDDREPADDRRAVPAERLRRPHRVVRPSLLEARRGDPLGPPAQRPRHRRRDRRAGAHGGRRAGRGHALRQRRAHRQRRPDHDRPRPPHAGRRPALDLSAIDEARTIVEECNELPVHLRHPYVGELAYTAFSGSHQDAIKKGMHAQERSGSERLGRPLPADRPQRRRARPTRPSSGSTRSPGRAASRTSCRSEHHLDLPRGLQVDFAQKIQAIADARGGELTADELMETFRAQYLDARDAARARRPLPLERGRSRPDRREPLVDGEERIVEGEGNGPIDALVSALARGSASSCTSSTTTSMR